MGNLTGRAVCSSFMTLFTLFTSSYFALHNRASLHIFNAHFNVPTATVYVYAIVYIFLALFIIA